MMKRILPIFLIIIFAATSVFAKGLENIEIFDINQGKVVKTAESSPAIQKEVKSYLEGITGIYGKINPIPDKGYMIKIPLEPSMRFKSQWLNSLVEEVIILFPEDQSPYLLVFDNENRALFFTFEGRTDKLLKNLHYKYNKNKE